MKIIVIGAGPTGLTLAGTLARRGHLVLAVERDVGPLPDGTWRRQGVMQFHHAHGFRAQVPQLLQDEWPEALEAWLELGAERVQLDLPGGRHTVAVRSRRITYERALRSAARDVPGLTVAQGTVTGLIETGGAVRGVTVDGRGFSADLVVDASGRGLPSAAGPTELDGECGISYAGRAYRLHEGADRGPLSTPISWGGNFDGYQAIVFPHEDRHFSVVIVRASTDHALRRLRHPHAFDAAARAIPALHEWTRPERAAPSSAVLLGGRPRNTYRAQRNVPGLVAIGDAVATTTPTAGRGVALGSMQIRALLGLVDAGADLQRIAEPFGAWCATQIRPWVEEHLARDDEAVRRLSGGDIDLRRPLTTTAIVDAAAVEARIVPHLAPYLAMTALPASLAPAEPLARAVHERGWRPALADGPARRDLVATVLAARAHQYRTSTTPDPARPHAPASEHDAAGVPGPHRSHRRTSHPIT
jgi:2-polyprenyl-6-methoxyphenol hydroxylase-like FAD-dependent oxidoreductase